MIRRIMTPNRGHDHADFESLTIGVMPPSSPHAEDMDNEFD
jgi:hypothetical protein